MVNGACINAIMLRIELTSSWLLITLALVFGVFLIYWTIRNLQNSYYSNIVKYLLTALRIAALFIFILMLTDLQIETSRHKQEAPELAVLWDLSRSMKLADSTFNVRDVLNSNEYKDLKRTCSISHYWNMQAPVLIKEGQLRQLDIDERSSDIGTLLRFADSKAIFDDILLISDGNSYLGESPESIRLEKGLKVHAIGVGNKKEQQVPRLRSLKTPAFVLDSDSLLLSWYLYNPSEDSIVCDMILRQNETEIFRKKIYLPAKRMIPIEKTVHEVEPGLQAWDFIIVMNDDEHLIHKEVIKVHDSKVNILCYSDPGDQDIAMMAAVLRENKRYNVVGTDEWEKNKVSISPDLIIQTWHAEARPRLDHKVPSILVYRDENNNYINESDLRVRVHRPYVDFSSSHRENERYWTQLPPVQVARYPHSGTVVLQSINERPLILEDRKQRSIIINAAGLWRWNLAGYNKDWNGIYTHLIKGLVSTLLWQFDNTYIALDDDSYSGFEFESFPIAIQRVMEQDIEDAEITLKILDSNKVEIRRKEFETDQAIHQISLEREGDYFAVADMLTGRVLLESDTAVIRIEKNNMEIRDPGCNEDALKALVEHHDGEYFSLNDLNGLQNITTREKKWMISSTIVIARNCYLLYALMFLMLVADWVIRKRNGGI